MSAQTENKELNLERKVNVINLTNIDTYVPLRERMGTTNVPAKGKAIFTVSEVLQQKYANNRDFVGTDFRGTHASLYIDDKEVRVACEFESEDGKTSQEITSEKTILDLFSLEKEETFYNALQNKIVTLGEKQMLRQIIGSGKVNSHNLIEISKKFLSGEEIEFTKKPAGRPRKN